MSRFLRLVSCLCFGIVFLILPKKTLALSVSKEIPITVSATVGEPKLTLFGYSSPHAQIELQGNQVFEGTIANEEGYFFFDRAFLPWPTPNYPELCLTAIDTQQRPSFPLCLPPLPTGPYEITVGPVLLPPTISLEKGNFLPGEQVTAQGSTIPNTEVTIFLASEARQGISPGVTGTGSPGVKELASRIVKKAYAYSLPQYQIRSDENGNFEFNLPANWPTTWRIFAAAKHLDSPTPKSNSLEFNVLSWWQWLWEMFLALLALPQRFPWSIIIIAEIGVIVILLSKTHFHSLRQDPILHLRLNKILRWRNGGNIKNRPT